VPRKINSADSPRNSAEGLNLEGTEIISVGEESYVYTYLSKPLPDSSRFFFFFFLLFSSRFSKIPEKAMYSGSNGLWSNKTQHSQASID